MTTSILISILAVACGFMLFVLVELAAEARRPQRGVQSALKVIAFRGSSDGERRKAPAESKSNDREEFRLRARPAVLPLALRRLTVKRAARR